jgi:hypothetical protein
VIYWASHADFNFNNLSKFKFGVRGKYKETEFYSFLRFLKRWPKFDETLRSWVSLEPLSLKSGQTS